MLTLKKRQDFLNIAESGIKWVTPGFVLQMGRDFAFEEPVVGFTASRKVGKAVHRNRAKRRLRELAREILSEKGRPRYGYVVIARQAAITKPFNELKADLNWALKRLHQIWDETHAIS